MAYAHSKLMAVPVPPVSGEMELLAKGPEMLSTRTRAVALQVRRKQEQNLQAQKRISIPRRDAMLYMTAEVVSALSFFSAEPAEARVGKLERKKKIVEKLEKLREEAGVSKPKTENRITPPALPPPMNPKQG
ncbi:hypothetical protein CICLE_v10017161mg [Citrus x clementina]|uniref:Uncharacterized protein n=1 Tax=Citrus clementina TaxID=85681 RepID=V4TM07_CITCL|nr:uncharacterized protein LOC18053554 [Citrus x clementina]ESR61518.1 hypothetical protein CICLE_v10017161mg [Citrus x clementina]